MSKNFSATRDGLAIAVTTGSLATQLSADLVVAAAAPDALIDARGSFDSYIKFGGPDVTVTIATGVRIPAGSMGLYGKGNATHMAAIGDGATQLVVHLGEGV